ncbi:MAG: ribulokinase [Chloroflexota bacterium]
MMSKSKYAIGIDFGTESGRALLVDVADGCELATSVYPYANGVIDEALPGSGVQLEPDWALQDPDDYLAVVRQAVPAVLKESAVDPADVIGLGIAFTSCTMLPTLADGTPLCRLAEFRAEPHAWVKLWKHHAAQPEADRVNELAREMGEPWADLYGGKISSEWFFPKALQILDEAPYIYHASERLIEAADWVIWQLTGNETRNSCMAGYKAIWQKSDGYPSQTYLTALHPDFGDVVSEKMGHTVLSLGSNAGGLTREAAEWTGLRSGTAVAVANVDAHATPPAAQAIEPGIMTIIMGTSNCHMVVADSRAKVPGMCGVVEDGIVPGLFGYEAGQSAVGDIFGWFIDRCVPPAIHDEAAKQGVSIHDFLEREAATQRVGQHGILALDWWNGNRSTLVDAELSGMLIGATLATTSVDIYRALLEATAFGTRRIIDAFVENGVPVNSIVAAGGLPKRNPLLMQIYADVTNREFRVARSELAGALGSAMHGAVVAGKDVGGYADIFAAAKFMGGQDDEIYRPIEENVLIYNQLYSDYYRLYDYFGLGEETPDNRTERNDVMKRLRSLRRG